MSGISVGELWLHFVTHFRQTLLGHRTRSVQVLRDFLCVTCVTSFCSMVEVRQVSPTSYGAPDVDLEFVGTLGREEHQETSSSPPASSDSHGSESDVSRLGSHTSSGKLLDPTADQEWQTAVANVMSTLQPTRDEVLRGVAAFHVLKDFGKIFRRRHHDYGKLYGLGRQMEWIHEFWSHSWKGSPLAKIWLLLMLKNGIAALVIGSCIALILAILSLMGYLPGYNKVPLYVEPEFAGEYHFAPWANLGGNLSALVTLLLWRSRDQIFIDLVCIHQQDPQLKAEGLLNLGAFLKRSKQLIVACDNIYWTRAWCVFEVAAFLKSHGNSAKIVIRPTALVGVIFFLFWALLRSLCSKCWCQQEAFFFSSGCCICCTLRCLPMSCGSTGTCFLRQRSRSGISAGRLPRAIAVNGTMCLTMEKICHAIKTFWVNAFRIGLAPLRISIRQSKRRS